ERGAHDGAVRGGADGHGLVPAGGRVRPQAERGDEGAADLRLLTAPRARGARQADRDREDRAEPGAAQEGRLLARPVARPGRGAGPAGDHQSVIAPVMLVLAQSLAGRVAAAPDGTVRLSFAARPGVCGNGVNIISLECRDGRCGNRTITHGGMFDRDEVDCECQPGPVRVALTVRGGAVQSLRAYVAGRWATPAAGAMVTDLGAVAARDAADFLLDLARRDGGRAADEAIFPATIADSVTVWPTLLNLARAERVARRANPPAT